MKNTQVNKINYDEIVSIIRNELVETMNASYNVYKDYEVILSSEQQFIKTQNVNPKAIYVVVKFGAASVTFGQSVLPVTLSVMGEENKLDIARMLLSSFAETYNLTRTSDNTIQQVLEAPTILSNFNMVQKGFRNLLSMGATFVVSKNANFYTLFNFDYSYTDVTDFNIFGFTDNGNKFFKKLLNETPDLDAYQDEGIHKYWFTYAPNQTNKYSLSVLTVKDGVTDIKETKAINPDDYNVTQINKATSYSFPVVVNTIEQIPVITTSFGEDADLDVQAFYFQKNFSQSIVKLGTLVYNFTSFLLDNYAIFNTAIDIVTKDTEACPEGVNKTFKMAIKFKSGKMLVDDFKMVNFTSEQQIGEIPVASFTFAN